MEKKLEAIEDEDFLTVCSFRECARIRIDDGKDVWISREENQVLYDQYMKSYGDLMKLSHGYCPGCYEGVKKDFGLS